MDTPKAFHSDAHTKTHTPAVGHREKLQKRILKGEESIDSFPGTDRG